MFFTLSVVAVVVGGLSYYVGLWDWPKFVVREFLCEKKNAQGKDELFAIVATSTNKDFASVIPRLLQGTRDAVLSADESSTKLLEEAASLYGAPEGAGALSVGLYFDDPQLVEEPKWAIGWSVATNSYEEAQALAKRIQTNISILKDDEAIRAVRLGPGPVLTGRIPWRHMLTPMLAPMIHWKRAFAAYEKGGFATKTGTPEEHHGTIACEVYVTGRNDSLEYIDYLIPLGDTTFVLKGAFPQEVPTSAK